jgi:hypothetical protein
MILHRPCGACAELVPADTGCAHWKPGSGVKASATRMRRATAREELERFQRMMTRGQRG